MKVLVIGGAGYIGSHAVRLLNRSGHDATVLDSLVLGHAEAVPAASLTVGDLSSVDFLTELLVRDSIEAVMHFAAFASVPESVIEPAKYYENNLIGTIHLLEAMRRTGVSRLVFSSTCATYGIPESVPITEETAQRPINPYGFTKLACERAMADYSRAYGLGFVALRYFNASGAAEDGSIGEDHDPETHLIPIALQAALGKRDHIAIYGNDYPTPDGTCIRDYIHVDDLAEAHRLTLERIEPGAGRYYNVGTGRGFSVREVIESARRVTGRPIPAVEKPRRPGDPPALVAAADLLRRNTGWAPRYTEIDAIVASAWRWHSNHPEGYA